MNRATLQVLTWATILAALASAMLLAALGDEGEFWRFGHDDEAATRPAAHGGALPVPVPHSNPSGARPAERAGDSGAERR